jgi:hypothetical protein
MCTQDVSQWLIYDVNCFNIKERKEGCRRRMMGWTDKRDEKRGRTVCMKGIEERKKVGEG